MSKIKNISKILAGVLAASIVITDQIPVYMNTVIVAQAEEITVGNSSFTYTIDGDNVKITKYTGTDTEVVIPDTIDGKSVTSIGMYAFSKCDNLTTVSISNNVTKIASRAFDSCKSLVSVNIPSSVIAIESFTFYNCTSLKYVNIPDGVTSIGLRAFCNCSSLTDIVIPNSVTSISLMAFEGCDSLKEITVAEGNTNYKSSGGVLFNKEGTELICYPAQKSGESYDIPSEVTSIAGSAFYNCNNLISVSIPDGVTEIQSRTFEGCSRLVSVNIPKGVTGIGSIAFEGCSSLTSIDIPDGVTEIQPNTFEGCSSLKSINIPDGVISIGPSAFENCSSLKSINIPRSVTTIYSNPFAGCISLTEINVAQDNTRYKSINGVLVDAVLYNKEGTELVCYPAGKSNKNYDIPNTITSIGNYAFSGCRSLTGINIPNSVTSIWSCAFENCSSLTNIIIPDSVTEIGENLFYGCSSFTIIGCKGSEAEKYAMNNGFNFMEISEMIQDGVNADENGNLHYYKDGEIVENYTGMAADSWTGRKYWFDNGVAARDKQVYDPDTKAWYWFDADGTMAMDKDVFVPESNENRENGKWVRYDENGGMVKGEDFRYDGWYHFDEITGEMIKGWYTNKDGKTYYYNDVTGQMEHGAVTIDEKPCAFDDETGIAVNCTWYEIDGNEYWYENGVRQGMEGRGKEIYDPESNAWYWLDSVDGGKKAKSKDVYQESYAGIFADREDGTGKWVRYDESGHMIKGWSEMNGNTYYFDYQTGAMAKGWANIDGVDYYFDEATGIRG